MTASPTNPVEEKQHPVLIIGAGITGLVLAQGLKKAGIPYLIFEKDAGLNVRSNEWTMAIHWSLERLEEVLPPHLWTKVEQASCNPAVPMDAGGNYPIINGDSGDLLAGVPYKRGIRVPRSKMRALCAEGIDVQMNKHLEDVAFNHSGKGVIARFTDGTMYQGSMLLGADGSRSRVREFAMDDEAKASVSKFPIWHMNFTVCYRDADKARYLRQRFPTSYLALSPRHFHAFQSISSMPDGPDHPESWVFHLAMAWLGDSNHSLSYKERLDIIREKASQLEEPARSAFTWIPDDTAVHKADISYWISEPWNNHGGLITLVGDAAHPMPPYRGQGLNHCICDVNNLVKAITKVRAGETPLKDAVTAYDEEIVPRGREEVKCSLENASMLHDWEKVKQSPVFRDGFKPMDGHDKRAAAPAAPQTNASAQTNGVTNGTANVVSDHAQVHAERVEEKVQANGISAH